MYALILLGFMIGSPAQATFEGEPTVEIIGFSNNIEDCEAMSYKLSSFGYITTCQSVI